MGLNKKMLRPVTLFGFLSILSFFLVLNDSNSIYYWLMLLGSLGLLGAGLIKLWRFRNFDPNISPQRHSIITTEFTKTGITFPNGYFFKWSDVNKGKEIKTDRISEVNPNTAPPSFVIDSKEVIFIKYEYLTRLEAFAKANNIPVVQRPEIWEMLCEPYLDTEFDKEHQKRTINSLVENGLSEEEVLRIRNKINNIMLFTNSVVWEWCHLGQHDYLTWTSFLSKKKYWWTMEIALRNYKPNIHQSL